MRYIVNDKNYVTQISFGSPLVVNDCECTLYTGETPSGYDSLEHWYLEEECTLWRWKIIEGNLTLDPNAKAPDESQWGIPNLQDKSVTPTAYEQTVTADEPFDGLGKVKVIGDADLQPSNIKSGVELFGVLGAFTGGYVGSPATATGSLDSEYLTFSVQNCRTVTGVFVMATSFDREDIYLISLYVDFDSSWWKNQAQFYSSGDKTVYSRVFYDLDGGDIYRSGNENAIKLSTKKFYIPSGATYVLYPIYNGVSVPSSGGGDIDFSVVTVTPADVRAGKMFFASDGTLSTGTMPYIGRISETIDGLTETSKTIPAGYTEGGTVSLTDDIADALSEI
jgi:hypothetical protein